jgi:S-adenosylmethionine/arginine decarboxylase-like enzyme
MEQKVIRQHKHIIIRAYVKNPPKTEQQLSSWCCDVIGRVGMNVISGPHVVYSDMVDNEGFTAVAVLDFSHLSIHTWDKVDPALIEFDLFSCKDFDIQNVLDKLNEFDIITYSQLIVDRDSFDQELKSYRK